MNKYHPPRNWRPSNGYLKVIQPGLDLPCSFLDDVKALDKKLFFVWHPWKILYDNVSNCYEREDTLPIQEYHGKQLFGYPLKQAQSDAPVEEAKWHIWRLTDHGWCHVVGIESKHPEYLNILIRRLHLQASLADKYGMLAAARMDTEENQQLEEAKLRDQEELFQTVNDENEWLMKRAMDNYERGNIAPTNPTRDSIYSYAGQGKRSKVEVPLDDKSGGIYTPD